jgi:hypothetical protein
LRTLPIIPQKTEQGLGKQICETRVTCGIYENLEDCMSGYLEYQPLRPPYYYYKLQQPVGQLLAEIEAWSIVFNSSEANKCLEAHSQDCSSDIDPAACDNVLKGKSSLGESCFVDQACIGDAYCLGWDSTTCELGICVESAGRVGAGERCGNEERASREGPFPEWLLRDG